MKTQYKAVAKLNTRLARLEEQAAKMAGKFVIVSYNGKLRTRVFGTKDAMNRLIPTLKTTSVYERDNLAFVEPAEQFMAREISKCTEAIRFFTG